MATGSSTASVSSSASNTTLLAANPRRTMAAFYNDSTAVLYLKCGATASSSSYTVQLAAGGYYELPVTNHASGSVYSGIVDGIWASANGNLRVTEFTR